MFPNKLSGHFFAKIWFPDKNKLFACLRMVPYSPIWTPIIPYCPYSPGCFTMFLNFPIFIIASASADASADKSAAKYSEISAFLCF